MLLACYSIEELFFLIQNGENEEVEQIKRNQVSTFWGSLKETHGQQV